MSFLNKILKRQEEVKAQPAKKEKKAESRREESLARASTGGAGVILAPHITEKAAARSESGQYVFRVVKEANKIDVRRAVEARYSVHVENVHMVNTHGKERRRGRQLGWKPGIRKAIVTLRKGETIDIQ